MVFRRGLFVSGLVFGLGLSIGSPVVAQSNTFPSSGSVGIGTVSPSALLDLRLASGTNGKILSLMRSGGAYAYHLGVTSASKFQILDNNGTTARLTIDTSGRLGIGTDSPTQSLDVIGNGVFSGTVVAADPVSSTHLATKSYVDGKVAIWRDTSENITSLNVTGDAGFPACGSSYEPAVLFSVGPISLQTNDVLEVLAETQVANDLGYNLQVTSYVAIGTTASDTSGTRILPANGYNVTPANHYGVLSKHGTWQSNVSGNFYVNFVGYVASQACVNTADVATVLQGYGGLSLIRFR